MDAHPAHAGGTVALMRAAAFGDPQAHLSLSRHMADSAVAGLVTEADGLICAELFARMAVGRGGADALNQLASVCLNRASNAYKAGRDGPGHFHMVDAALAYASGAQEGDDFCSAALGCVTEGMPADALAFLDIWTTDERLALHRQCEALYTSAGQGDLPALQTLLDTLVLGFRGGDADDLTRAEMVARLASHRDDEFAVRLVGVLSLRAEVSFAKSENDAARDYQAECLSILSQLVDGGRSDLADALAVAISEADSSSVLHVVDRRPTILAYIETEGSC